MYGVRTRFLFAVLLVAGCHRAPPAPSPSRVTLTKTQRTLVDSARDQTTWGTGYSGAYFKIGYPNGDPPRTTGACTDVVVRAYRKAGYDLQKLIHEDMKKHWDAYPRYSGNSRPDTNIDHRRVPNQRVFFTRKGKALTNKTESAKDWQPGDIVTWKLFGGKDHVGVLTDRFDADGFPFVVHNIGGGPQEEDVLRTGLWTINGHYRYPK